MIRLEHPNLVVKEIKPMLKFYQAAFPHWYIRAQGISNWYGVERNWLHFGDDFQYLTFNDNGKEQNRELKDHQVGMSHFAYTVCNLKALIARLAKVGFKSKSDTESKYRKNIYFIDPSGYEVEFVEYFSDLPTERNCDE